MAVFKNLSVTSGILILKHSLYKDDQLSDTELQEEKSEN